MSASQIPPELVSLVDALQTAQRRLALDEREFEHGMYSRAGYMEAVDNAESIRAALDARLAELCADAARLDWIDEVRDGDVDVGTTHLDAVARIRWRDGLRPREHTGQTIRDAIDAARTPPDAT